MQIDFGPNLGLKHSSRVNTPQRDYNKVSIVEWIDKIILVFVLWNEIVPLPRFISQKMTYHSYDRKCQKQHGEIRLVELIVSGTQWSFEWDIMWSYDINIDDILNYCRNDLVFIYRSTDDSYERG